MEEISCTLFHLLDYIGYNQELIKIRRNFWQQKARILNADNDGLSLIHAGSKGEGITSYLESDVDFMFLLNDAICTHDLAHDAKLRGITVLYADTSEAPPGYTRLKLISNNGAYARPFVLESIFESESEGIYLSSPLFASSLKKTLMEGRNRDRFCEITGPAVQDSTAKMCPSDHVLAFHCYNPEILQSWKSRPRLHEWPPENIREDAASMLAQVVPVGSKGSCDQWREWRFCFIKSELELTYSLNETQLKLYILLKMVAKEILCQVSKEISSYVMKNITYWLSELLPGRVFRRENLITLLFLSLRFLKSAISQWNCLPYYMIPGRNLLAERLTPLCIRQLSGLIKNLLEEGPLFIFRCAKLRTGLTLRLAAPALALTYQKTKHRVELWLYCWDLLEVQNADPYYWNALYEDMCNTILPEVRKLLGRGFALNDILYMFIQILHAVLS